MLSDKDFLNIVIKDDTLIHKANCLYKNNIGVKEFIDSNYKGLTVSEVAYRLLNNISTTPTCKICGKQLVYSNFGRGYGVYCCKSCAAKDTSPVQAVSDRIITKETILENFVKDNKIIEQRCLKAYLKKNGWFNPLLNYYSDSESCYETIYRIINDIDTRPVCKTCGGKLKFSYSFPNYCSAKCRNNNPEVLQKNSDAVSKSLKKIYINNGSEIKEKRYHTLNLKYGIDSASPFDSSIFRQKAKDTIKERYGVENVYQLEENRQKSKIANRERSIKIRKLQGYDIEYLNMNGETKILLRNGCPIHGDLILDPIFFNNRTKEERREYTTLCPYCNPLRNPETSIETTIKNILNELNIKFEQHNRTLIHPYELDFYLPDYNIAIECNGIFWHSGDDNGKRLIQKRNLCIEHNIRLLYFWENDIHQKTDIIRSYLQSLCSLNKRIYARKCVVREIDSKTSREFIDKNHLQGNINASVKLGLFYNNDLVEVMTFGKQRKCLGSKSIEGTYELYRLCSLSGYTIVGGASKLLKYFIDNYKPNKIITYCSNDISDGNVYEKIGFHFVSECGQGYCYIHNKTGERKNRFALRKSVVDDKSGRTEEEINYSNGWLKCYDTGNKKYEIINK